MAYNSDNFDLTNWKLTLPVNKRGKDKGEAHEITDLENYELDGYFYDAADGAMVFRAGADDATTTSGGYARNELRELNGDQLAFWNLQEGGTLTATLKIDEMPVLKDDTNGRFIVGQIHGIEEELVRLYYDDGAVYFANENAGPNDLETSFALRNAEGLTPSIAPGEIFSYEITARADILAVRVYYEGELYESTTYINDVWLSDAFYFKAGIYMGVNKENGSGEGQVSFYGLDFSHVEGQGYGGLAEGIVPPPITEPPVDNGDTLIRINGTDGDDVLVGNTLDNVLAGYAGNDSIEGATGDDFLWGNDGDDTLIGGLGADTIKGGNGADIYVYHSIEEAGDQIIEFRQVDKIDMVALLDSFVGVDNLSSDQLIEMGYVSLHSLGAGQYEIRVDADGASGTQADISLVQFDTNFDFTLQDSVIFPNYTPPTSDEAKIRGTDGAELLQGNSLDNQIIGYAGDDTINGGLGDDYLWGNNGNDILKGGSGADTLKGGSGVDQYVFDSVSDAGDEILQFRAGEKIILTEIRQELTATSDVALLELVDLGYLRSAFNDVGSYSLYVDRDGSAGVNAEIKLVTIDTNSEFILSDSIIL